jgi:carboxylesterase type B
MMTMWTHFAATGDPSVKGLVKWPAYNEPVEKVGFLKTLLLLDQI